MKKIRIFCDFDGTIALADVGDGLFKRYAEENCQEAVESWKNGEITAKECLIRECALTRITYETLMQYIHEQEIDPSFVEFVRFCTLHGIPLIILSDGLDIYIEIILERYGLGNLPFYANKINFVAKDRIRPEFPFYDLGCKVCGNCKGYHIRRLRQADDFIVFIGDGFSDRCGAEESDLIFAKGDLLEYCLQKNLACTPFNDFKDILKGIIKLHQHEYNQSIID